MKLERRIKLKGFDNILYSTTEVDCCTSENWNFLLCYAAGSQLILRSRGKGPTAESDVPIMGFHGIPGIDSDMDFAVWQWDPQIGPEGTIQRWDPRDIPGIRYIHTRTTHSLPDCRQIAPAKIRMGHFRCGCDVSHAGTCMKAERAPGEMDNAEGLAKTL